MLVSFARAVILYLALILVIRLMGKRQLGQMEPTEFVVTMLIADLASVPMQDEGIPLLSGLIPILVVLAIELLLSVLVYHSVPMRRFFCGKPVVLMHDGKLEQQNLRKTRVTPDELTEFLRLQGVTDLTTVQYAILETDGTLNVIPFPNRCPVTAEQLGIDAGDTAYPYIVISNGRVLEANLKHIGRDLNWLKGRLKSQGIKDAGDVFLMTADQTDHVYLAKKEANDDP